MRRWRLPVLTLAGALLSLLLLAGCVSQDLSAAGKNPGEFSIECSGKAQVNGLGAANIPMVGAGNNNFSLTTDCGSGASIKIQQGMPTP